MATLDLVAKGGSCISSPCFDANGTLWVCSKADGGVYSVQNGELCEEFNSGGQPHGIAFDKAGALHIADPSRRALLRAERAEGAEGGWDVGTTPGLDGSLRGPTAVAVTATQQKFFTDSGPLGDSTIGERRGRVFSMDPATGNTTHPVVAAGLAHPCALCVCPVTGVVYCAEMLANRILRFVEEPEGVWQASVFRQLHGRIGPSCLDCDQNGDIYVGHYESRKCAKQGLVTIIRSDGSEFATVPIGGPEITGLCIKDGCVYVTEASEGEVWRYTLPSEVNHGTQ